MSSAATDRAGVQVRETGSFHAGGRIVTLTDQPRRKVQVARRGPARMMGLNGGYVTGQCYARFVKQAAPASGARFVPRWTSHGPQTLAAYEAALERTGPVWLIAHSQGGTAGAIDLPAMGNKGNSHVPMMDRTSNEVAQIVFDWISRNG